MDMAQNRAVTIQIVNPVNVQSSTKTDFENARKCQPKLSLRYAWQLFHYTFAHKTSKLSYTTGIGILATY